MRRQLTINFLCSNLHLSGRTLRVRSATKRYALQCYFFKKGRPSEGGLSYIQGFPKSLLIYRRNPQGLQQVEMSTALAQHMVLF